MRSRASSFPRAHVPFARLLRSSGGRDGDALMQFGDERALGLIVRREARIPGFDRRRERVHELFADSLVASIQLVATNSHLG